MTARRALVLAVVLLGLASGACDRSPGAHEDPDEGDVPTCEPGFATPDGFTRTETFEDPYADHVGIRLGFSSDDGRELHAFVGVPGEFGEGLPLVDSIEAAGGIEGSLQGSGTTWVLSWRAPGPCGVRAVLGSGFTREGFVDTLERAGIVPAQ